MADSSKSLRQITEGFVKLDRFDGGNFLRWQKKVHFLLTTLKIVYVLSQPKPNEEEDETVEQTRQRTKWETDDYLCRGHILNALADNLFDLYQNVGTAKTLWETLETKYLTEDATSKKFLIGQFLSFKMHDNRPVLEQFHDIQRIINHCKLKNLNMDDNVIVSAIIEKLPPSWKDYKKELKHKKEDLSLEELETHLRIEQESRILDGKEEQENSVSKVHVVEEGKEQKYGNHGKNNKRKNFSNNSKANKKKKGNCFHCNKPGHFKKDCREFKKLKEKGGTSDTKQKFAAMISEANMLGEDNSWWIDSGATRHVCKDKSLFSAYETVEGDVLYMGNSSTAAVKGKGTVDLEFTSGKILSLTNVFHVPDVRKNLVSGSLLNKFGFKLVFESDKFILTKSGTFVGKGYLYEGMFKLNINEKDSSAYIVDCLSLWHSRLGHVNTKKMHFMVNLNLIPKYENDMNEKCKICMQTKITRLPFPKIEKTTSLLHLVHSDVCDLHGTPTRGGSKYFATFIDDFSKYCYVYLLNSKDDVLNRFKTYKNEVENQCDTKIKCLRSDRGGEYHFPQFCEDMGIIHEVTAPYTPQQNGVAERKNRTLTEMVNAMLSYSGLSKGFWGEALLTACHILNRIPVKDNKKTPYELWKNRKPNLGYLKVWGCRAIVRLPETKRKKLGSKGVECIFIGYAQHSKAYRFLVSEPNDSVEVNTIIESRDAIFYEQRFSSIPRINNEIEVNTPSQLPETPPVEQEEIRKSKRPRKEKSFGPDFVVYLVEGTRDTSCNQYALTLSVETDPQTYSEAIKSVDSAFWKEAINDEMDSIMGNKTWKLVDLPPGSKPIKCRWIFKKKMKIDGTIDKFKARLVAKGFTQKEGIDYFDTYAPVARTSTIRILIALASIYNFEIHQMDVKTAFLNGDLEEEIYMEQPEGFVMPGQENKVCKLIKSLYGLKQAPKQWHEKFDKIIISYGFKIHESDKCVYSKFANGKGVIICLYVDDMLILGTDLESINNTKSFLSSKFDMKDMGVADVILGMRIIRKDKNIILTQSHYVEKILKKFNQFDCTPVSTPFEPQLKMIPNTGRAISQLEYARVIGSLMYAMTCTRPDIAYAVGKLSRYTSNPSLLHWHAVNRILKYLKGTMDYGIYYSGYPSVLEGFSDASWITEREDHSSTSGWIFTLGGGAVSWGSKKQTCIADSTMAAEFVALAATSKEAEWLRNLLIEIPVWPKPMPPISIHCDSESTLSRAYSKVYNGKSRHIGLRHSYVRQMITDSVITVDYVKSSQNLADPFTKGLARGMVSKTSLGMGLKPINNNHS